jgi:manganese transport protein
MIRGWLRRTLPLLGSGYVVAVGYIDPGNWATDIAAGAHYGYALLWVVIAASIAAAFLQTLTVRMTLATGKDLAQLIRERFPQPVVYLCWGAAEIAMVATDVAELLGAAIALNLLFGMPIVLGTVLAGAFAIGILALPGARGRVPEYIIGGLFLLVTACFAYELVLARPPVDEITRSFAAAADVARDPSMLYLSIAIIGATIMPHNLYLHSGLTRALGNRQGWRNVRAAARHLSLDCWMALGLAGVANAMIMILAAVVFGASPDGSAGLEEAYRLLGPAVGVGAASVVFAVALLLAGQSATATGSMAGQFVMEGFFDIKLAPWLRALITRAAALVPAIAFPVAMGERGIDTLLVMSQAVLGLMLPFVLVPMLVLLRDRGLMRRLPAKRATVGFAGALVSLLVGLNLWLGGSSFG